MPEPNQQNQQNQQNQPNNRTTATEPIGPTAHSRVELLGPTSAEIMPLDVPHGLFCMGRHPPSVVGRAPRGDHRRDASDQFCRRRRHGCASAPAAGALANSTNQPVSVCQNTTAKKTQGCIRARPPAGEIARHAGKGQLPGGSRTPRPSVRTLAAGLRHGLLNLSGSLKSSFGICLSCAQHRTHHNE